VNFETVTVNGLAVANVPGRVYVLACNPNDNSVSLIDTTTNTVAQRVPVGLGPVAVTWNPSNNRFYTANLIGDSVTAVEVTRPNGVLQVRLIGTEQVFDEPMDVAIGADGLVYVAQGGRSALTRVNATTLATVDAFFLTDDFLATNLLTDPFLGIPATNTTGGPPRALRTPRRLVMDGTLVHVLSLKGDTGVDLDGVPVGSPPNPGFKYSMLTWDTATQAPAVADAHWNTFGSANEAMVRGVDGNLYVVGSLARNDVRGNAALSALPRGFVESHVWTVPSGLTPAAAVDRDLNDDGAGNTVAANLSAATPAGVALLASGNNVTKVFVSSFGTDRIIELNLAGGSLPTAGRTVITVPAPAPNAFGAVMSGPRDLEIATTTAGARLYCLNDLDCSVSVFDPNVTGSPQLARVTLANRLSASQQVGRRFLYDARVSLWVGQGVLRLRAAAMTARRAIASRPHCGSDAGGITTR
jgi:YVTN family beta-propeller protein